MLTNGMPCKTVIDKKLQNHLLTAFSVNGFIIALITLKQVHIKIHAFLLNYRTRRSKDTNHLIISSDGLLDTKA